MAASQAGKRALIVEQFGFVHDRGAHSGQTRIFRYAYAEGADYIPLVMRADSLWQDLEAETALHMLHRLASLKWLLPGICSARRARESAARYDINFQWLAPAEIRRRWPMIHVPDDWEGGFGPDAGFLDIQLALNAMVTCARRGGAELISNSPVSGWGASSDGVWITAAGRRYDADALIVTAGAWARGILQELHLPVTIERKVQWWLKVEDPAQYVPERFPVFITDSEFGEIYALPVYVSPGLKIANHTGGLQTDPDHVNRAVAQDESQDVVRFASWFLDGVGHDVLQSVVCLYTRTPDGHFVIDRHPQWPNVIIGAGFSGHGFKFAPAIGEHLVALALESSASPRSLFSLARFARF